MKSFLLLILSLIMTGCEDSFEVKGCLNGWVEFSCKYPEPTGKYGSIVVVNPRQAEIQSTKKNVWETTGNVSLYHDTRMKELRVAIKQLRLEDFGQYHCKFDQEQLHTEELDLVDVKDSCQGQFLQTAYRAAKTTITCDYPGNKYEFSDKFFCKEDKDFICEDILSSNSSLKFKWKFTLTETNSSFSLSISYVHPHDAGVYWCGVKSNEGSYRTALRKIQLEVKDITKFKRSPCIGQNFTYWCGYPNSAPIKKFICKGEDPSICQQLVSTTQLDMNTHFSMKDRKAGNITITVREVTTNDTGTYWCGAESTESNRSNPFFHRFLMTVVPQTVSTIPPATSPPASAQPPTVSDGGFDQTSVLTLGVCLSLDVLLLLVMLTTYFVCTGYETRRNTRRGA